MSLLNDVMRDLQTRGVMGLPPLAGLQPVADVPPSHYKRHMLVPILGALMVVAAVVMWRPVNHSGWLSPLVWVTGVEPAPPEAEPLAVSSQAEELRPVVIATGKDLRELFDIEAVAGNSAPDRSVGASAATNAATVPEAVTETIVELPAVESQPIAAAWDASSMIEDEPVAPDAGAKRTAIQRREPGIDDVGGIMMRAQNALRKHDLVTAERAFREALVIDSGNAEIWTYLYSVLVGAGRPAAAEQTLRQGLNLASDPSSLAKLYARVLVNRGDKEGAVRVLNAHRPAPASDAEYDAFLAALLQQTGSYAEAGEVYRGLLVVDPDSGAWLIGLAMSDDSLGNISEALPGFERALESGSLKSPLDRYARRRIAELQAYE